MTAQLSASRAVVQFNGIAAQLVLGRNNVKKTNNTSASTTSSDATAVSATAGLERHPVCHSTGATHDRRDPLCSSSGTEGECFDDVRQDEDRGRSSREGNQASEGVLIQRRSDHRIRITPGNDGHRQVQRDDLPGDHPDPEPVLGVGDERGCIEEVGEPPFAPEVGNVALHLEPGVQRRRWRHFDPGVQRRRCSTIEQGKQTIDKVAEESRAVFPKNATGSTASNMAL
jgi:hypothetical protein